MNDHLSVSLPTKKIKNNAYKKCGKFPPSNISNLDPFENEKTLKAKEEL